MRGVLLCGGNGTRLRPMTEVINKHLVRVGTLPMAEYPLQKMIDAGIKEILIVSGGENFAAVVKYFGSGKKWNVTITHAIQDQAGGIAEALSLARAFAGDHSILVCLGDNIWSEGLDQHVRLFKQTKFIDAMLFTVKSKTPERFGVLRYDQYGQPVEIVEKPQEFISDNIVVGIYIYHPVVFDIIDTLVPSARGELEITDVNQYCLKAGRARIINMDGWWTDCGTIETLLTAEEQLKHDRSLSPLHSQRDS